MAGEIDFLYGAVVGRTPSGEPVTIDISFWENLVRLLDRTGGSGADFIQNALAAAASAEATADGKITSVWQDDAPDVADFNEGDLWFDTNDGNKPYQLRSGAWVSAQDAAIATAISAAAGAQATADTRITTFYQTSAPTALAIGDLWHDTDDAQRRTYRWNGSAWQNIADQTPFNTAAAITGQGPGATAAAADVLNAHVPSGANAVIDHGFARHADSALWAKVNTTGKTPSYSVTTHATGLRYYGAQVFGGAPNDTILGIYGVGLQRLSCVAGDRIEIASWISGFWMNTIRTMAFFFDSSGALLATLEFSTATFGGGVGALSNFTRLGGIVTAPSGAASVSWGVYGYCADAVGNPYVFVTQPFLSRARAGQTAASDWSPGFDGQPGADITASNVAASVTGQGPGATVAIPTYAGNAAALAGGLLPGATYIDSSDGNKLKAVQSATGGLSVTLSRYSQNKTRVGAGTTASDSFAATVTGGSGSYEYVWERYAGEGVIDLPEASSVSFSQTVSTGESKVGKFRLSVHDTSTGAVAFALASYRLTETS